MPFVLQVLVLVGIALGAVASNILNIYSGAMAFLTLGIKLGVEKRRAISALVFGAIGLVIGLLYRANVGTSSKYESFLLLVTYWITPWLAVVITDFVLHRGQYPQTVFYAPAWANWKGLVALLAGIVATIPFWDQGDPIPLGIVPKNYPQFGDLSFFAGAIVATVAYLVLYQIGRQPSSERIPTL